MYGTMNIKSICMFLLPDSKCRMFGILIRNVEYNIPSPFAGISFLKTVAGRTETGKSKWKLGFREPRKLLILVTIYR
jgi:hypothetical protein